MLCLQLKYKCSTYFPWSAKISKSSSSKVLMHLFSHPPAEKCVVLKQGKSALSLSLSLTESKCKHKTYLLR